MPVIDMFVPQPILRPVYTLQIERIAPMIMPVSRARSVNCGIMRSMGNGTMSIGPPALERTTSGGGVSGVGADSVGGWFAAMVGSLVLQRARLCARRPRGHRLRDAPGRWPVGKS